MAKLLTVEEMTALGVPATKAQETVRNKDIHAHFTALVATVRCCRLVDWCDRLES